MKKEIEIKKNESQVSKDVKEDNSLFSKLDARESHLLNDYFPFFSDWSSLSRSSITDIREQADAYILSANLPGVPKEEINISVSGNVLTIRAEHKKESGIEKSKEGFRSEYCSYHQSFTLPSNVDADQVVAHCENGRLEVFLPKNEKVKQRKIEVQSGKVAFQKQKSMLNKDLETITTSTDQNEMH